MKNIDSNVNKGGLAYIKSEVSTLINLLFYRLWLIGCAVYVLAWSWIFYIDLVLTFSFWGVLVPAAAFFVAESLGLFWDRSELTHVHWLIKLLVVLIAVAMLIHRLLEWRDLRKESLFADVMSFVLDRSATLALCGEVECRRDEVVNFLPTILAAFSPVLTFTPLFNRWEREVRMNVLLHHTDHKLKSAAFFPPSAVFDKQIEFENEQGAAGKAFSWSRTIYVPAVRYIHGVQINVKEVEAQNDRRRTWVYEYDLAPGAFMVTGSETFESLLCIPIRAGNPVTDENGQIQQGQWGVLCVDSVKRDCFGIFEIRAARAAATLIGSLLDRADIEP